jgi:hypothetical protein
MTTKLNLIQLLIERNLFGALYVSENWYFAWTERKRPFYRARAVVVFDRVLVRLTKEGMG